MPTQVTNNCIPVQQKVTEYLTPDKQVLFINTMNALLSDIFQNHNADTNIWFSDLQTPSKVNLLYERAFVSLRNIRYFNETKDFSKKELLPIGIEELSDDILTDIDNILNNKELFREWHKVSSTMFMSYSQDLSDIVGEQEDFSTEENEENRLEEGEDTPKKEFDKGINEEDPYLSIGPDLKVLFRFLIKSDFIDGKVQFVKNAQGLPEISEPSYIYSKLAYKINGVLSEQELINKLKDPLLVRYIPEVEQLNKFIGLDSNRSISQQKVFNQLYVLLSKPFIPIKILQRVGNSSLLLDGVRGTELKLRDLWEANFDAGSLFSPQEKRTLTQENKIIPIPGGGYQVTKNILSSTPTTFNASVDFLKYFGINITSENYINEDRTKVIKLTNSLYSIVSKVLNNKPLENAGHIFNNPIRQMRKGFPDITALGYKMRRQTSVIEELTKIESNYTKIFPSLSYVNIDGERQFGIANSNNISKGVAVLNKSKTIEELRQSSFFKTSHLNPLFQYSATIKKLFTNGVRNNNELTLYTLAGTDLLTRPTTYKNANFAQKMMADLTQFIIAGRTDVPRLETSNSFLSYGVEQIDGAGNKRSRPIFDMAYFDRAEIHPEVANQFLDYLRGELQRINEYQTNKELANLYPAQGDFVMFSFLNERTKNNLLINGIPNDTTSLVKEIQAYLDSRVQALDVSLREYEINDYNKYFNPQQLPEEFHTPENYFNIIKKSFVYNTTIQNIEFSILFSGDPSLYKENSKTGESEYHKRIKGLASTGDYWNSTPTVQNLIKNSWYSKDGLEYHKQMGVNKTTPLHNLKSLVINDIELYSDRYKKLFEASDGQGFITPDTLREAFISLGINNQYTDTVFEREALIFKKDILEQPLTELEEETLTQLENLILTNPEKYSVTVIKASYFGNMENSPIDGKVFDKFSLAPLFPSFIKNQPRMKKLLLGMVQNQIDYVKFATGTKGFVRKTFNIDEVATADPDILFKDQMKLQIATSNIVKTKTTIPTQLLKLIFSNTFEEGKSSSKITKIYNDYTKTLGSIQQIQVKTLLKDLGITIDQNSVSIDYKSLSNKLLKEAINRKMNLKIQKALLYDPQTKKLKGNLETGLFNDAIKLIAGIIDNTLRRYKFAGGDFVLITNALGNKLESYTYQEGDKEVTAADINITFGPSFHNLLNKKHPDGDIIGTLDRLNTLLTDKEWRQENKKLFTIILDRVPTQETNSMDVGIVAQFIPSIMGNVVMFPEEIIIKSGTDFDFDKEKTILPNINSDGEYISWGEYNPNIESEIIALQEEQTALQEKYNFNINDQYVKVQSLWENRDTTKEDFNYELSLLKEKILLKKEEILQLNDELYGSLGMDEAYQLKDTTTRKISELINTIFPVNIQKIKEELEGVENEYLDLLQTKQDQYFNFIETLKANKEDISELLKEIDNAPLSDDYKKLEKLYEDIRDKQTQKRQEFKNEANKIIEQYSKVLLSPEKFNDLIRPNSAEFIRQLAIDTAERTKKSVSMPSRALIFDQLTNNKVFEIFFTAKNMLAPYAKMNTYQQLFTYSGTLLNNEITTNKGNTKLFHRFLTEKEKEFITKGDKLNIGKNKTLSDLRKQDTSSQKINATVDAAKDPYFSALQIMYQNVGVEVLLSNIIGYSQPFVVAMLTQPALIQYLKSINKGYSKTQALHNIYRGWGLVYEEEKPYTIIDPSKLPAYQKNPNYIRTEEDNGEIVVYLRNQRQANSKEIALMIKKYNSTNIIPDNFLFKQRKLSELLMETPIPSLNEIQEYSKPSNYFRNLDPLSPGYINAFINEVRTVAEFQAFDNYSNEFRKITNYLNFDTKKTSLAFDNYAKIELRKEILESGIIPEEELIKLEKDSIVSKFNNIDLIQSIYGVITPTLSEALPELYNSIYRMYLSIPDKTARGLRNLPNIISSHFTYSILLNNSLKLYTGYNSLFGTELTDRFLNFKAHSLYSELIKSFPVFNQMYSSTHPREFSEEGYEIEPDFSTVFNINLQKSPNMTNTEENSIIYQFEQLVKQDEYIPNPTNDKKITNFNKSVKLLVEDIFWAGIAQSGLSKSHFSYQEFIPEEFYKEEYNSALKLYNDRDSEYKESYISIFANKFRYNNPNYFKSKNNSSSNTQFYSISPEEINPPIQVPMTLEEFADKLDELIIEAENNELEVFSTSNWDLSEITQEEFDSVLELSQPLPSNIEVFPPKQKVVENISTTVLPTQEQDFSQSIPLIDQLQMELDSLDDSADDTNPYIYIAENLPKITKESAQKETGANIGNNSDINTSFISDSGVSVERAAEIIGYDDRPGWFNLDIQEIRDEIINILISGKKAYIDSVSVNSKRKALQDEINSLRYEENVSLQVGSHVLYKGQEGIITKLSENKVSFVNLNTNKTHIVSVKNVENQNKLSNIVEFLEKEYIIMDNNILDIKGNILSLSDDAISAIKAKVTINNTPNKTC